MPAKKNITRAKPKAAARTRLLDQLAKLDELLGEICRGRMRLELETQPSTPPLRQKRR